MYSHQRQRGQINIERRRLQFDIVGKTRKSAIIEGSILARFPNLSTPRTVWSNFIEATFYDTLSRLWSVHWHDRTIHVLCCVMGDNKLASHFSSSRHVYYVTKHINIIIIINITRNISNRNTNTDLNNMSCDEAWQIKGLNIYARAEVN